MNQILEIIYDYDNGSNLSTLEKKYHKTRKTIRKVLFAEGLIDSIEPKRRNYFKGSNNDDIKNQLLIKYKTEKDLRKLCIEFNIPYMSIYNLLKKEMVFNSSFGKILRVSETRKYSINEQYFNEIDCEEKAYFLGMLYADGTNSMKSTEIALRLQIDDYEILEKLNNLLQPNKPISVILKEGNRKIQYCLLINSKIISYRLNELGMTPNKTFTLKYPDWLHDELHQHFIRGYFDGDGCVSFNKLNKQLCFSFTGTENMMLGIQEKLINDCGYTLSKLNIRHPERYDNIRTLSYFGNGNSRKMYDYLYDNANIYMKRKKNKFNKHLTIN